MDSRLSSAFSLVQAGNGADSWLDNPGQSTFQAYVRFNQDFPDDVVFGIDQEFFEGTNNPQWVSGGDWMGLVGLQRNGTVWVAAGTQQTMQGIPSTDRNWQFLSVGQVLQPDAWYRVQSVVDFSTRTFESFSIEGAGLNVTLDLSAYSLDYPNYFPLDDRALGHFVFAMRGAAFATQEGDPRVFFDDASASLSTGVEVLNDSFDGDRSIENPPLTWPIVELQGFQSGQWYYENANALVDILDQPFARTGDQVMALNVTLIIPEPSTWAALVLGFFVLGWRVRYYKRA